MPTADPGFFAWLQEIDCSEVKIYAVTEGTVVFPKCPLLRIHGPSGGPRLGETSRRFFTPSPPVPLLGSRSRSCSRRRC
jgi:hypothetical protein